MIRTVTGYGLFILTSSPDKAPRAVAKPDAARIATGGSVVRRAKILEIQEAEIRDRRGGNPITAVVKHRDVQERAARRGAAVPLPAISWGAASIVPRHTKRPGRVDVVSQGCKAFIDAGPFHDPFNTAALQLGSIWRRQVVCGSFERRVVVEISIAVGGACIPYLDRKLRRQGG